MKIKKKQSPANQKKKKGKIRGKEKKNKVTHVIIWQIRQKSSILLTVIKNIVKKWAISLRKFKFKLECTYHTKMINSVWLIHWSLFIVSDYLVLVPQGDSLWVLIRQLSILENVNYFKFQWQWEYRTFCSPLQLHQKHHQTPKITKIVQLHSGWWSWDHAWYQPKIIEIV